MTDDLRDRVDALHAHLAATEERPVEPSAGRWLGEAQAVAADASDRDAPRAVVVRRVGQVRDLLDHVDGAGDPVADERVAAARALAEQIVE